MVRQNCHVHTSGFHLGKAGKATSHISKVEVFIDWNSFFKICLKIRLVYYYVFFYIDTYLCILLIWERDLLGLGLCNPGWPWRQDPPVFASLHFGIKACQHTPYLAWRVGVLGVIVFVWIEHRALHKLCECFILLGCSFLNGYILKYNIFYLFLNSLIYVNNISWSHVPLPPPKFCHQI